jgi:CRP/FNR family transcriptional regulator
MVQPDDGSFHDDALGMDRAVWAPFARGRRPAVFAQGEILYLQGSVATHFYYIAEGAVKTFLTSEDGGERILTVYRKGDILGEASFFDGKPRMSSAMALTRCQIISIDRQGAQAVFRDRPELAMAMLKYLASTVRLLSAHVDDMTFWRADQRLARLLLSLDGEAEGGIRCTHEFLGHSVGVSRVTVSRVLGDFERQGLVRLGYRTVTVLDPEGLRALWR